MHSSIMVSQINLVLVDNVSFFLLYLFFLASLEKADGLPHMDFIGCMRSLSLENGEIGNRTYQFPNTRPTRRSSPNQWLQFLTW